jgi:AmiR/NasT family two-component response regulator
MSLWRNRLEAQIDRRGTLLTLNGTTNFRALVDYLQPATISRYLTSSEAAQITKPGLELRVKTSLAVAVNDTFTLDSRTFTIRKIARHRIADETICQFLIAW